MSRYLDTVYTLCCVFEAAQNVKCDMSFESRKKIDTTWLYMVTVQQYGIAVVDHIIQTVR
jgi:hypothetical protein